MSDRALKEYAKFYEIAKRHYESLAKDLTENQFGIEDLIFVGISFIDHALEHKTEDYKIAQLTRAIETLIEKLPAYGYYKGD